MGVTSEQVADALRAYAEVVARNRRALTRLDAAIGDADHGENLHRGMQAVLETLGDAGSRTPGELLKATAMALVSKVGGAAGPLYGTAFLRAATAVDGEAELDADAVVRALEAGLEGVVARGKAAVGDKTMIDAWSPAVDAARAAVDGGGSLQDALTAAADRARRGVEETIPLVARKGRASYLGERSAGHQDPGATSTWLLFATLAGQTDLEVATPADDGADA